MKIKYLSLLLFFSTGVNLFAQTVITGSVKDPSGTPVQDLYVIASNPVSKAVVGFAATGYNGDYTLTYTSELDSIQIRTSRLDYAGTTIVILNKNGHIDLVVHPQATNLDEIVIRPEAVQRRGDTLNFFVQRFASILDRSIGDVIKNLPGVEVMSSGQINYQGRPINEFMVEGLDLMGGRYGGVVNNLSYDDVSTIQILENHEPIRAKRDISSSDRAAINLKLKEDSRNKYLLSLSLGLGGFPLQRDNEGSLMQFAVRKQTNVVYKGNNVGKMIDGELRTFYGNVVELNDKGLLKIPGSKPPLSNTQRYLDNNAHSININRLYSLGKYETISIQGDFITDRQEQKSIFNTSYIIGKDSSLKISEASKHISVINKGNIAAGYRNNSPSFFLSNVIKGHGEWSNIDASITNVNDTDQKLSFGNLLLTNNFSAHKIVNKKRIEVTSMASYSKINEDMMVNNGVAEKDYRQVVSRELFATKSSVVYGGKSGRLNYDIIAGSDYITSDLESELKIDNLPPDDSLLNKIKFKNWRIFVVPSFRYTYKKMVFNVQLPLNYDYRKLKSPESSSKYGLYLSPSLGFRYDPSNFFKISVNIEREHKKNDITSLNKGYILSNYRTLNRGSVIWAKDTLNKVNLSLVLNRAEIFSSTYLTFFYTYKKSNLAVAQNFNDILLYRYILPLPVKSGAFSALLMHSKGFDGILRKTAVSYTYSIHNNRQIQLGEVLKNNTKSSYLNLTLDINPWESSDLRYSIDWTNSLSKTRKANIEIASGIINDLGQTISFQSVIYKYFQLKASAEHRKLFSAGSRIPSSLFVDLDIIYKRDRIELCFTLVNLLNSLDYAVKYLVSFSNTKNIYLLRQRSLMFRAKFSL